MPSVQHDQQTNTVYEVQEISYGVHRCEGYFFLKILGNGLEEDFCIEPLPQFIVQKGQVSYRVVLPKKFHQAPLDAKLLDWQMGAAKFMAQYLRSVPPWRSMVLDVSALDRFISGKGQ